MKTRRFLSAGITLLIFAMLPFHAAADEGISDAALRGCPEIGNVYVTATVTNSNYHIGVGQIFRAGPGGTISTTISKSFSVKVASNVSGSITAGEIVKASASAGFSQAAQSSSSVSFSYSHPVSAG